MTSPIAFLSRGGGRRLPVRSCLIEVEAIVCDANGLAVFDCSGGAGTAITSSCARSISSSSIGGACAGHRWRSAGRAGEAAAPDERRYRLR